MSAEAVLQRSLGSSASKFELALAPSLTGRDFFEVEARGGIVFVRASSPIALCRGAYQYLRDKGLGMATWSGAPIDLPSALPDSPLKRVDCRVKHRHYLSVCTYGYSAAWWDWERWERELDWMALHGIDMPLLLVGTEAVTRRVFLEIGLTEEEIAAHFSGPAYLCWHRLGNLNGHMGPLPPSWIDSQEQLQVKILDRARELGMHPIVPGFSGFVSRAFQRIRADVKLHSAERWAGFSETYYIDPRDPSFQELGRRFLEEYRQTYGSFHHYLCEVFAEQIPCLDPKTELEDLREIGRATWETLSLVDPDAHWVMQGWPFYFAREYWAPSKAAALLDAAPSGRVLVLDLATDELETWREQPALREKGWMFNVVHNYGQTTHLHGNLQGFIDRAELMLNDRNHGLLQGMGISPEGIDQNAVVYELLTDLMWGSGPIDLHRWTDEYARARYGKAGGEEAWRLMAQAIYGRERDPDPRFKWRFRPGDQPLVSSPDLSALDEALRALLAKSDSLRESSNYSRDVVDLCKTWVGAIADNLLEEAIAIGAPHSRAAFLDCLDDLDRLLATRAEHRLSTWLEAARSACRAEPDHFEHNARSLITWWGGPLIFDYAAREWAGLVKDFHKERWRMWFAWKDGGNEPDFGAWEQAWSASTVSPRESAPEPEILVARELHEKYIAHRAPSATTLGLVKVGPQPAFGGTLHIDLGEETVYNALAVIPVFGQGMKARYQLKVSRDNKTWLTINPGETSPATCRGVRAYLPDVPIRHLRVQMEIVEGHAGQQYQIYLWR
jgi:alpha-N-acetylglucosaminidase